jgi:hypothetical protein
MFHLSPAEALARAAFNLISENFPKVKRTEGWLKHQGPGLSALLAETLAAKSVSSQQTSTSNGGQHFWMIF